MITPRAPLAPDATARHYDQLDRFYRELWGEHLHHGLWTTGQETPEQAVVALARLVAERAGVRAGMHVCDVGCGYGATARLLARDFGACVTALTIAPAQHAYATSLRRLPGDPCYLLRDWLANALPAAAFDAAVAIESTEHMADKPRCMAELARVLRPGGRGVVCAWLSADTPSLMQQRWLLEPICHEGRLPGLATEPEYRALLEGAGLVVEQAEDVSARVRRTWPTCIRRVAAGLLREPSYRRFLLGRSNADRVFVLTLPRLWAAYATGAMRYVIFTARRGSHRTPPRLRASA
jgi:tocopherol O-methyltransferase